MQTNQKSSTSSFRTEREFGLIVGAVFALLGGWWLYRQQWPTVATVFASLGATLILLGAVYPRSLVYPNKAWMGLAKLLSLVTTPIILAIVYFVIVMPIGVLKKLFGSDPLRRRAAPSVSYWTDYNPRQRDPRHFEKMF